MSVTFAKGFKAAGVVAGLKSSGKADVSLVVNDGPNKVGAGVFTSNRVKAAPVKWSLQAVNDGVVEAVLLNSGGANACTGPAGFADTHHSAEQVAKLLDISPGDVLVCSTGLIGLPLDMPKLLTGIAAGVSQLDNSDAAGVAAAQAIMTTDTVAKTATFEHASGWRIGGMAKGAGMLAPGLATMLCVITTDAVLPAGDLQSVLRQVAEQTFNRIDSDGCMSTNDSVILLASGSSGLSPELVDFAAGLHEVCWSLGKQLIADAEGASHEIEITVVGARDEFGALEVARSVSRSNLFKAAIFGNDPNWGRILSALGTVSPLVAPFDADDVDVSINGVKVCQASSIGVHRNEVDLAASRKVTVLIDLKYGDKTVTLLTNDLTHDYVHENSAYSS